MPAFRLTRWGTWAVVVALVVASAAHAVVTNRWPAGTSFGWSTSPTWPAAAEVVVNLALLPEGWALPDLHIGIEYKNTQGAWVYNGPWVIVGQPKEWHEANWQATQRTDAQVWAWGAAMAAWQWFPQGKEFRVTVLDEDAWQIYYGLPSGATGKTFTTNIATALVDTRTVPPTVTRLPAGLWNLPAGPLLTGNVPALTPLYGRAHVTWAAYNVPAGARLYVTCPGLGDGETEQGYIDEFTTTALAENSSLHLRLEDINGVPLAEADYPINVESTFGGEWMRQLAEFIKAALGPMFANMWDILSKVWQSLKAGFIALETKTEQVRTGLLDLPGRLLAALADWLKAMFKPSEESRNAVSTKWGEIYSAGPWMQILVPIEGLKTGMDAELPTISQWRAWGHDPTTAPPQYRNMFIDISGSVLAGIYSGTPASTSGGIEMTGSSHQWQSTPVSLLPEQLMTMDPGGSPTIGDTLRGFVGPLVTLMGAMAIAMFLFSWLEKLKFTA
jgi:hypothetical protein